MITVDIKSLLEHLNPFCTRCLESAAGLCVSRTHYEVTVEHLFAKLIEEQRSDLPLILRHFDIDPGRFEKELSRTIEGFRTGNAAKPVFSPLLMEWFQDAWLSASIDLGENRIRSGALILSLLKQTGRFASDSYIDILYEISHSALLSQFGAVAKESVEQPSETTGKQAKGEALQTDGTALGRFCTDFTEKARAGEIDPVFGRDREIRQMVDILARRRKNNPIVVGEAGVGKTAVVEGLALRIVQGDVPDLLANVSIVGLDMGLLQAGAGVKGEFENRLKSVINEIKASPTPIILFIDEAHVIIGAGGAAGGSDAANLLKPALARGELRTVAATTWSEYKKYFEKDAALARRFQLVKLDEPSVDTATLILRGLKEKYEDAHGVVVRDDAIVAAAELSSRYISGRYLPDKAVDLLDTSAARVKILLTSKPDIIEDKERTVQGLEREKTALDRDRTNGLQIDEERFKEIEDQLGELNRELEEHKERWQNEQGLAQQVIEIRKELNELKTREPDIDTDNSEKEAELKNRADEVLKELEALQGDSPLVRTEVNPDVVAKVVSDWTDIPLGKVMRDEARNIISLEENLTQRIKGQDDGIGAISQVIKAAKAGLKDPAQPLGIFLLVGPSGVGKTETGLAVADLLFGGERFMVSINMSEFQEKHTVSRLIGSPPGYVGYGEGGVLTEAVRQRPYSVVLLDEVEKANPEVMNLFYQVFDKGVLSDGEGRVIDFKNTVLFLTSNLASDVITELCSNGEKPPFETIVSAIRPILSNHFKPALVARMSVIPFYTLDQEIMKDIVCLKLDKLVKRMADVHKMKFVYSPEIVEQIASRCIEVETGARNIDHIMNGTILPQMSLEILGRMSEGALPPEVHLDVAEDGTFKTDF
ncbi:MAG: type VI secretion system ATPase TssH [Desulfobacterales bacterium]|nr:type VI secretion system ATPase TssH [Desulfobacterales bacterium]